MPKEKKLIPELRFPEFKNEGEWVEKQLQQIGDVVASSDLDIDSFSQKPTNEHIYPIYSNSVSNEGLYGYSTYFKHLPNSITITARGTLGVAFVRNSEFVGIGRLLVISNIKESNPIFIKENWNYYAKIPLENGGIPQLTAIKAKAVTLLFPNPQEQQKIASCLSSLDDLIAAHNQKLELLKDHKKGLMQNLFPQEGEKVPKYRFKEFEKDGEWVEKSLEEVAEVNPASSQLPDEFVYIDLESVENGVLLKRRVIQKEEAPSRAQRLLKDKDVIFQMVRPYQKNNYYFNRSDDSEYVASTGYAQLRAFESSMYLYQFIHTDKFVSKVLDKCTGSNYPAINSSNLSKIMVQIPNPKEQQKIAWCLSSLDELIKEQAEKIEQLKQHKKGVMQGLFPKIED